MHASESQVTNPLLTAPVGRSLVGMAGPISVGMLSTFLFQVVDTYFVGQIGSAELGALGFAATAYFLVVGLFMGLSVGVSAAVGSALGEGEHGRARELVGIALLTATMLAIAVAGLGIIGIDPMFRLLGADAATRPLIGEYMQVLYAALPLLVVGLVGGSAIRATGKVKGPEIVMGLAGVINLVLDYLLIFGVGPFPELGLQGAALATGISWAFVALATMFLLVRAGLLGFAVAPAAAHLGLLARLSGPAIATQILLPLTAMFITSLAARSGSHVVAAFGVAQRIETLALVGISALSVALVPFVAQNHGADARTRIDGAIAFTGRGSVYWGAAASVLLIVGSGPLARIFSDDPEIIRYIQLYFYIVAPSYWAQGLVMMAAAIFNGVQLSTRAFQILAVKSALFTLPLAGVGALFGAWGVFAGLAVSHVAGAIYAGFVLKRHMPATGSRIVEASPMQDYRRDLMALAGYFK